MLFLGFCPPIQSEVMLWKYEGNKNIKSWGILIEGNPLTYRNHLQFEQNWLEQNNTYKSHFMNLSQTCTSCVFGALSSCSWLRVSAFHQTLSPFGWWLLTAESMHFVLADVVLDKLFNPAQGLCKVSSPGNPDHISFWTCLFFISPWKLLVWTKHSQLAA